MIGQKEQAHLLEEIATNDWFRKIIYTKKFTINK